jgi:hypothetical protein
MFFLWADVCVFASDQNAIVFLKPSKELPNVNQAFPYGHVEASQKAKPMTSEWPFPPTLIKSGQAPVNCSASASHMQFNRQQKANGPHGALIAGF